MIFNNLYRGSLMNKIRYFITKTRRSKASPWIGDEKITVHYFNPDGERQGY